MKYLELGGNADMKASQIAIGCMRMTKLETVEISRYLEHAVAQGINFFDHADIYGKGECEEKFASGFKETSIKREDIFLQSKCGIRPGFFDFSKKHILSAVDGILERLDTDYLDVLALHRPDTLMEPEEVTEAFVALKKAGKVRQFGVSNQNPGQMRLLKKYLDQENIPLIVNQLQLSMTFTPMIDAGFNVNMQIDPAINRDGGILEYCRLHDVTIQAWSPFQYGFFEGVFIDNPKFKELNDVMEKMADKYGVTKTGLAVAWISRHPANIQTIIGTMTETRVKEVTDAADIQLSREDWYELYRAAGNKLP
ncbi:aldo/keto reductase [Vagococcus elongatus]|uniref:Aldo/keto reductase n=1 Tax=Vagococcus elongatus TaxID=180344 RepID=A0A430ANY6_9ENTE|nr:aldo/keto reductase [Vagococcus elongatus]RSU09683.1 aldo/keto reductase [Vagococcus elongatus]